MFNFITNVVLYKRLKAVGYRLDDERNIIIQNNIDIFCMYEMYGQTVIHYKAVLSTVFPAIIVITVIKVTTVTIVITVITAITVTMATGFSIDLLTVITSIIALFAAVLISLRKPLKNRSTDGMIWYFCCSYLSKEVFESMVKWVIRDEIEVLITL